MPIWYIDQIKTPLGTIDIGLIRDKANVLALRRRPRPKVPTLGENLADIVEKAQAATHSTLELTATTPVESIPGGSPTLSSSSSTPPPLSPIC